MCGNNAASSPFAQRGSLDTAGEGGGDEIINQKHIEKQRSKEKENGRRNNSPTGANEHI